jgi:hypothetical protein
MALRISDRYRRCAASWREPLWKPQNACREGSSALLNGKRRNVLPAVVKRRRVKVKSGRCVNLPGVSELTPTIIRQSVLAVLLKGGQGLASTGLCRPPPHGIHESLQTNGLERVESGDRKNTPATMKLFCNFKTLARYADDF